MTNTAFARPILLTLLALTIVAWSYTYWDAQRLSQSLSMVRDCTVLEYERHSRRMGGGKALYEVVGVVTTGREHGVWGKGIGKITLYTRKPAPFGRFYRGGIEFYYEYDESSALWDLKESVGVHGQPPRKTVEAAFLTANTD